MSDVQQIWERLHDLIGTWAGDSVGEHGRGTGGFAFSSTLDGRLWVRSSRTDFPATETRAAYSHEDITWVYRDPASGTVKADYVDNEDHVIHYSVDMADNGKTLTFESDPISGQPQFRLSYTWLDQGAVEVAFAIALPGQQMQTYIQGPAYRTST